MTRNSSSLRLALLAILVATAVTLLLCGWAGSGATRDRSNRRIAPLSLANPPVREGRAYETGALVRYRFEKHHRLELHPVGADHRAQSQQREWWLRGSLELRFLEARATGWRISMQVVRLAVEGDAEAVPPTLAGVVRARLSPEGELSDVRLPVGADAEARRLWASLLADWQLTVEPQDTWEAVEEDPTGAYLAQYRREAPGRITKEKGAYTRLANQGAGAAELRADVCGRTLFVLDPYPVEIAGTERLELTMGQAQRVVCEAEFRYLRDDGACPAEGAPAITSKTRVPPRTAAPELALSSHLSTLRRLAADRGDTPEFAGAMAALSLVVRKAPGLVDGVLAEIEAAAEPLRSSLALCLAAAGTPPAQRGLLELLARDETRRAALHALVQVDRPIAELDQVLWDDYRSGRDLSQTALLVLAAVGDKVRALEPARFGAIEKRLTGLLREDLAETQLLAVLTALGNLGPRTLPEEARVAAHDWRPHVRAAALRSLARVRDSLADQLLREAFFSDRDVSVQRCAFETLLRRSLAGWSSTPDLTDVLAAASRSHDDRLRELAETAQAQARRT